MRIFKKPDLRKESGQVSENIFRDPKELELFKAKVKPEEYLRVLFEKIEEEEKNLTNIQSSVHKTTEELNKSLAISQREIGKQIGDIDGILQIKRAERAELDKPFIDRTLQLNERESIVLQREKEIEEGVQAIFERERAVENKLESLTDLADSLGETRVRLSLKEKTLNGREELIKNKEIEHLGTVQIWSVEHKKQKEELRSKEYAVELSNLNLQGKEENLEKREKALLAGYIRLEDQRGVLERAWKELKMNK